MAFDLGVWKATVAERLVGWKDSMARSRVRSIYVFLATLALLPLAQAAGGGGLAAGVALGGALSGVGTNLLANIIQKWKDGNEQGAAQELEAALAKTPEIRAELDAVLEKVEAFSQAREALPETERPWFAEKLRDELTALGNLDRFQAMLIGDGAIAQGLGAVAAGKGGIAVKGDVKGSIVIAGQRNVVAGQTPPSTHTEDEL